MSKTAPKYRLPLFVSVSGGETSAYMAKHLKDEYSDMFEMIFVMANTGLEWEATLEFADRCDREWGLNLVMVEALVHPEEGKASTHNVVRFETASRNGEPFEEVIKKYGIPNKAYPHCTRELKLNPMRSYVSTIWRDYFTAVGIRMDEPKRVRKDAFSEHIFYPLAHWFPTDKQAINSWWEDQPFRLNLQPHQGNCKTCWKKSTRKLVQIAQETPEAFDWNVRMEAQYGLSGHNVDGNRRVFFREHMKATTLLSIAEVTNPVLILANDDSNSGCSESCEPF